MTLNFENILIALCAIGAAVSFLAFLLPYLERAEKKQRVMDTIAQKRKTLYKDTRDQIENPKATKNITAAQSVTMFFQIEKLAGNLAVKWRTQLNQAGYRSPKAVVIYMILRVVLPVGLSIIAMLFLSAREDPMSEGITLLIIMAAAAAGFYLPSVMIKNQAIKRQEELNLSFPDALDLMLICVQGGLGIEPTIDRVAKETIENAPALGEELGLLSAELGLLSDRKAAFKNFSSRVGSGAVRTFANAMIQAEKYGTGVSKALRVLSDDLRDQRMANAEQKAAALPPKLTVPMILFFLPALFIVILGPAVIQAMSAS